MENAKLTVKRHWEYTNRFSRIFLYLDGKKVGFISNGKERAFKISAGDHNLYAQLSYFKTRPLKFHITASGEKVFQISSPYKHNWITILASSLCILFALAGLIGGEVFKSEMILLSGLILSVACMIVEIIFAREHSILYYMSRGKDD